MTATSHERLLNSVPLRAELHGIERCQRAVAAAPSTHIFLIIDIESFAAALDGQLRLRAQITLALAAAADAAGVDSLQFDTQFMGFTPRKAHVVEHGQQLPERDGETDRTSDFAGSAGVVPARAEEGGNPSLGGTDGAVFGPRSSVFPGTTPPVDSAPLVSRTSSPGQCAETLQEDSRRAQPGEEMPRSAAIAARSTKSEGTSMPRAMDPSLNRRKLRIALRQAREAAGLTQQETARQLEWSPSKVIRIEIGTVSMSVTDLRTLMGLYGITEPKQVRDLEEAARGSRGGPWWSSYKDVTSPEFVRYLGFEAAASSSHTYWPVLPVPDLPRAERLPEPEVACGGFRCGGVGSWMVGRGQVVEPCSAAAGMYGGAGGAGLRCQSAGTATAFRQMATFTWCPDDSGEAGRCIACLRLGSSTARTDWGLLEIAEKIRNAELVLVIIAAVPATGTECAPFSAELDFVWAPAGRDKLAACPDSPAAAPSALFAQPNRSCGIGADGLGAPLAQHVAGTGECGRPAALLEQAVAVGRPCAVRGRAVQHGRAGNRRIAPGCRPGHASSLPVRGCRRGHGFSTSLHGPAVRHAACSTGPPRQSSAPHVLPPVAARSQQHTALSRPGRG